MKEELKRNTSKILFGISCMILAGSINPASAIPIISVDMDPVTPGVQSTHTAILGSAYAVDVVIAGLGNLAPPSLGAFSLDVSFDATLLNYASTIFGTDLGASVQNVSGTNPVSIFEVSLESIASLNASQPGTFRLFTMNFDTVSAGNSVVALSSLDLSDEIGNSIGGEAVGGMVSVQRIPSPGILALLSLSFAATRFFHRRPAKIG